MFCVHELLLALLYSRTGLLFLIMSLYAILGVEFFGHGQVDFVCASDDYFDSYSQAMMSLMQVLTGDSWCECIARPCMYQNSWSSLYFISFNLIASVMLMVSAGFVHFAFEIQFFHCPQVFRLVLSSATCIRDNLPTCRILQSPSSWSNLSWQLKMWTPSRLICWLPPSLLRMRAIISI